MIRWRVLIITCIVIGLIWSIQLKSAHDKFDFSNKCFKNLWSLEQWYFRFCILYLDVSFFFTRNWLLFTIIHLFSNILFYWSLWKKLFTAQFVAFISTYVNRIVLLDYLLLVIGIAVADSLNLAYVQGPWIKSMTQSLSLYFILRVTHTMAFHRLLKFDQAILPYIIQTLSASCLPLACISNTVNKPSLFGLNVSFPSLKDISWNLARVVYFFNIQLERNAAT